MPTNLVTAVSLKGIQINVILHNILGELSVRGLHKHDEHVVNNIYCMHAALFLIHGKGREVQHNFGLDFSVIENLYLQFLLLHTMF